MADECNHELIFISKFKLVAVAHVTLSCACGFVTRDADPVAWRVTVTDRNGREYTVSNPRRE